MKSVPAPPPDETTRLAALKHGERHRLFIRGELAAGAYNHHPGLSPVDRAAGDQLVSTSPTLEPKSPWHDIRVAACGQPLALTATI